MLKINLKYFSAVIVLILSITLTSCNPKKPDVTAPVVTDQTVVNYTPTDEEATTESRNIIDGIINNSILSYTNLDKLSPDKSQSGGGLKKTDADPIGAIKYVFENGFYTWNGTFTDPQWPDAFKGTVCVKLQFKGSDGKTCTDPKKAASMYSYLRITGAFGFTDPEPKYGDKSTQTLEGTWSNLRVTPNFHGEGLYQRCWIGVYNDKDVTLSTTAKIKVDHMQLFIENNQVLPLGLIYVYVDCYKAVAMADGTNIITVNIYKNGTFMRTSQINVGDRLVSLAYYLNLMN